ncbi:ATP-binding protein, partial [Shigella flexneri]|nr:ATP-binding protein [Shigella flexneri]
MKISEVFTAGGVPNITYNSRENLELEDNLTMDLDIQGKIISITGPTKIGKTTLCKKVISMDNLILISGGAI